MDRQIGVQIEGEKYIRLVNIDKERHGKLKFTTIQDEQRRAVIKVYLFENDSMKPLKEIEVSGIPPEKAGVPEIDLSTEFDGKNTLVFMVTLNGRTRLSERVEISSQFKGVKKSLVLVPVAIIILVSVFYIVKKTAFLKTGDTSRDIERKEQVVVVDKPERQLKDNVKTEKEKGLEQEAPGTVETEKEIKSPNSDFENNNEYKEAHGPEVDEIADSSYSNEYVRTDVQEDTVYEPTIDIESGRLKTEIKESFVEDGPLKTVFFDPGRAALTREAFEELDKIIPFLKENRGKKVFISGHCALYSSEEGRLQLSEMRASNVYWYLRDRGWKPRAKPDVSGFGGTQFVTAAQDSQHLNRRVEIRIED
jgi:outer membrane protein OmpA-like peptidoglycan-associated protein